MKTIDSSYSLVSSKCLTFLKLEIFPQIHSNPYIAFLYRWLGWNFDAQFQQDHEASLDVRIQNLWTQTLIIAQQILDDQNDVTILPEEVSTVQKGTDTFLRLLSKANTKHQFILLANLLNETWQNGEVFQNAKVNAFKKNHLFDCF